MLQNNPHQYDLIAVLGYGFSFHWTLPEKSILAVKKAAELYKKGTASKIAICGRWSINWDLEGITPPTTEAEEMKKLLLKLTVPSSAIYKEEFSKDTIGNAFFLKTKICQPYNFKRILIICLDHHLKRVKFIFQKIFGEDYKISFFPIKTKEGKDKEVINRQKEVFVWQKEFLKEMKTGDDNFLKYRLYNDPYYKEKRSGKISQWAGGVWLGYLKDLKTLLSSYEKILYLKGKPLPFLNLFPKEEGGSGFLVFLVEKEEKHPRKLIVKILWEEKFKARFDNEIFIYKKIPKIKPQLRKFLPSLVNLSSKGLKFFEIEYLDDFDKLGETQEVEKISSQILKKILKTISLFHLPKSALLSHFNDVSLNLYRGYPFYFNKLFRLDTAERISHYFGERFSQKMKKILEKSKEKLIGGEFLVLGDRNPSNVLIKDNKIKLIDFDRVGFGNPALDFTFLFLVLIEFPALQKELMEYLKERYQNIKNFWFVFWFDVLFRSADVFYFWEKRNKKRAKLVKDFFLRDFDKINDIEK